MANILDDIFMINNVESEDELVEDDYAMLKSMFNSEPVINLFTLFNDKFELQESTAFIDLYSHLCKIPLELIPQYFLPCHIQYIYLIHLDGSKYYIFMYNYDPNPVSLKRQKLFCMSYVTDFCKSSKAIYIHNLMGLKLYGFTTIKQLSFNTDKYDSFKNMLYFCTQKMNEQYEFTLNDIYNRIINDAHLPLLDLNNEIYY